MEWITKAKENYTAAKRADLRSGCNLLAISTIFCMRFLLALKHEPATLNLYKDIGTAMKVYPTLDAWLSINKLTLSMWYEDPYNMLNMEIPRSKINQAFTHIGDLIAFCESLAAASTYEGLCE